MFRGFLIIVVVLAGALRGDAQPGPAPKKVLRDAQGDPLPEGALFRLGTTRYRLGGFSNSAVISPDGKTVAVSNNMGIEILDALTGKQIRTLNVGGPGTFSNLIFSPDGKSLIASSYNREIRVHDVVNGGLKSKFVMGGPNVQLGPMTVSGDGKTLAMASHGFGKNCQAFVWDVATGKPLVQVGLAQNSQAWANLSPDGKLLATWGNTFVAGNPKAAREANQTIQIWDVKNAKELRKLVVSQDNQPNPGNIGGAALAPDGKTIAVYQYPSSLMVMELATGKILQRLNVLRASQATMAFSPDGKILALSSLDGTVQVWEAVTYQRLGALESPLFRITSLAFLDKGVVRAMGVSGESFELWDLPSGKSFSPPGGHRHTVSSIHFDSRGDLYSGSKDAMVCVWDSATGKEQRHFFLENADRNFGRQIYPSLAISPTARFGFINSPYSSTMRLWDLAGKKPLFDFQVPNTFSSGGVFSPDDGYLAAPSQDHIVRVWNAGSGKEVGQVVIPGVKNVPHNVRLALSPGGKKLAICSGFFQGNMPPEITILDTRTEKLFFRIAQNPALLLFSPDGKWLTTGNSLFDAVTGKLMHNFNPGGATAAFSPDGRLLALGSILFQGGNFESSIHVWEIASGQIRCRFTAHRGQIQCLAFSPDGRLLASGGSDTTVLLWDLRAPASRVAWPEQELKILWADLLGDAEKAHRAIRKLLQSPAQAIALLKKELPPPKKTSLDGDKVARLIADLDSDLFALREKASRELEKLCPDVVPALIQARAKEISPEARQRINSILKKFENKTSVPDHLRKIRALEVLEYLGTPEARAVLAQQASGPGGDPVVQDARAALTRLEKNH